MQRLFCMFPSGQPGAALVLLRVSVAISAVLAVANLHGGPPLWALGLIGVLALSLFAGFLTPIVSLLAAGSILVELNGSASVAAALLALQLLALAGLGPGAYSVDALCFGRRELFWPPDNRTGDRR